jgi:hypothetical protein
MTPALPVASRARARVNRMRWWWRRRMGWAGALAMLVLIAAAVVFWAVRPAIAASQRDLLRAHVARLDATARLRGAAPDAGQRDPRDAVRDAFPPVSRRGESIATLLALLEQGRVSADRAEYVAQDEEPGLVRVRMTLPIEGGYGAARQLIAAVLNGLPHAALDGLDLERPSESGERLSGQLRFSLFFRKEVP